jgi:hypothetical protein
MGCHGYDGVKVELYHYFWNSEEDCDEASAAFLLTWYVEILGDLFTDYEDCYCLVPVWILSSSIGGA